MIDSLNNVELGLHSKKYKKILLDIINEYNSNGKKTVLITCDTFFPTIDGVVMVMDNYARRLSSKMNVMMLVPDYKGKVCMKGYPVIGVNAGYSTKLHNQVPLPMFHVSFRRFLRKLRIDIIHCHSPFTVSRVAMDLHRKRNIPLVNTFHSQYKQDFEKDAKVFVPILMKYIMRCYNSSNEVWTMHSASRDTLIDYGYKGSVRLIPNGTSISPSADYQAERKAARDKYGVDDDTILLIFVGRLVTQKNILFIADVLAKLRDRGLNFKMLFAGEGPDRGKLEDKIISDGLSERVSLLGQLNRDEITDLYAAADLFLFPSLYDVSSLVQVEAASRYTPTVFAKGSVTSCTVTDGVNGYVFDAEADAYADGVYNALQDKERLLQIGQNAFRDLYITWDEIVDKVYNRYMELIESNAQVTTKKNT